MNPDAYGKSWFDSLIAWDAFEQLWELVEEHERELAVETMMATLDYAVMKEVMTHLHTDHHHSFLEMCHDRYHEPMILFWLEERATGVTEKVRTVIITTYEELYSALSHT